MVSDSRSMWQKIRKSLAIIGIVAACIVVVVLGFVEILLYGTGFIGKTLWDWLQLLFIPVVLLVAGFWLSQIQKRSEERIAQGRKEIEQAVATDNQQAGLLQAYIDNMSELLVEKQLRKSALADEIREMARARTLTVLPRLHGPRKRSVLQFLHEAGLIDKDKHIIDLHGATLNGTNLREANLGRAYLDGVDLSGAILEGADQRDTRDEKDEKPLPDVDKIWEYRRDPHKLRGPLRTFGGFLRIPSDVQSDSEEYTVRYVQRSRIVLFYKLIIPGLILLGLLIGALNVRVLFSLFAIDFLMMGIVIGLIEVSYIDDVFILTNKRIIRFKRKATSLLGEQTIAPYSEIRDIKVKMRFHKLIRWLTRGLNIDIYIGDIILRMPDHPDIVLPLVPDPFSLRDMIFQIKNRIEKNEEKKQ